MKKKNKAKTIKILKGEKLLYIILFFLVISVPISNVFIKALLSETNIQVEQMKSKIEKQKNINESLNNDNIKVVNDDH